MSSGGGTAAETGLLACKQCDKRFTRPENLARHMKTHSSARKHSCSTCGKQFTRSDLRKKHELLHERSTLTGRTSRKRRKSRASSIRSATPSSQTPTDPLLSSYAKDHSVALPHAGGQNSLTSCDQTQTTPLDESFMRGSWADDMDLNPYFDYTTFARPWNYSVENSTETSDWFSSQFIAALRETDLACSPPVQSWPTADHDLASADILSIPDQYTVRPSTNHMLGHGADLPMSNDAALRNNVIEAENDGRRSSQSGHISRNASPPNESSLEDRLPFAWDPRSRPIARAKPIVLAADDPIFASIDNKVEITQTTLSCMKHFLRAPHAVAIEDTFTIPDLPLVNVFISLFFSKFLPQAPVLHRPTLRTETLPPALLCIIMVIGSCYSRLRNTRRFGIIVLDRIRKNLLSMIEEDNSLMREPFVIYATALVCYMGLWCGNKRAFELSEAFRAVVVTYIRRLPESNENHGQTPYDVHSTAPCTVGNLSTHTKTALKAESQWHEWIAKESQKRLRWFVYMIDAQFPSILGMSSMLTTADVRRWQCPCDEGFWILATARSWKHRLGSASEPACVVFGSLVTLVFSTTSLAAPRTFEVPLPSVNAWSANLLLSAIMGDVFHYQDMLVVLRTFDETPDVPENPRNDRRAAHLLAMLEAWDNNYSLQQLPRLDPTSAHLHHCSTLMYYLARLYLVFPVSDVQDCLGRSGSTGSQAAMVRLKVWISQHSAQALSVIEDASTCINIVLSNGGETDPYDIIGLFLCHVIIWAFAHAADPDKKKQIVQSLRDNPVISGAIVDVIEAGFANSGGTSNEFDLAQLIFRHAIHSLAQLGDWGAASNLALLLHLHPGT